MPIHQQLWSAERNRNIELPENNDVATAATFIASHPSPLEGSRGNETAKMLSAGLCLTETSKKMLSEMQSQIRKDIAGFLNATFLPPFHLKDLTLNPWPRNQGILTSVHHPRKVETFTCSFGNTWFGVPKVARTSTSDRYPKACSPWIYRSIKTRALFSFQVLPVSRWGKEQVFTDGKGMLPYWCVVSEISRVHWQGGINGSIRQFLKPTGHQQLEVGGFGQTWSPQPTDYGIVAEQPVNDSCWKSSLGFGLNH